VVRGRPARRLRQRKVSYDEMGKSEEGEGDCRSSRKKDGLSKKRENRADSKRGQGVCRRRFGKK